MIVQMIVQMIVSVGVLVGEWKSNEALVTIMRVEIVSTVFVRGKWVS